MVVMMFVVCCCCCCYCYCYWLSELLAAKILLNVFEKRNEPMKETEKGTDQNLFVLFAGELYDWMIEWMNEWMNEGMSVWMYIHSITACGLFQISNSLLHWPYFDCRSLHRIPTQPYHDGLKSEGEDDECIFCVSSFPPPSG